MTMSKTLTPQINAVRSTHRIDSLTVKWTDQLSSVIDKVVAGQYSTVLHCCNRWQHWKKAILCSNGASVDE